MRPEDQYPNHEASASRSDRRHSFFFYESVGGRAYFRFTGLGVALVAALTVIPIAALLILFLSRPAMDETKVDVTIRPLPSPTFQTYP